VSVDGFVSGRRLWFTEIPATGADTLRGGYLSYFRVRHSEDGRCWAVLQAPVHEKQLSEPVEFAVMPFALLDAIAAAANEAGAALPASLEANRHSEARRIEPEALYPDYVRIDGEIYLVLAVAYQDVVVRFGLFDGNWLALLCPTHSGRNLTTG
jgi:hypothetical protein